MCLASDFVILLFLLKICGAHPQKITIFISECEVSFYQPLSKEKDIRTAEFYQYIYDR